MPHNHHFLWFAATMEGASEIARAAAADTGERTSDPKLMRTPGFEAMQNFSLTPLYADVRFGHWDEVMAMPKPADDLPYMQAMWNYGQAMAAARQGRIDDAKKFHEALVPATTNPDIEKLHGLGPLFADRRRAGSPSALRRPRSRAPRRTTTARSRR